MSFGPHSVASVNSSGLGKHFSNISKVTNPLNPSQLFYAISNV